MSNNNNNDMEGTNDTEFPPKPKDDNLMQIMAILVACAQQYTRGSKAGNALLVQCIQYLEGRKDVGGVFDPDNGEPSEFWDGVPLKLIYPVFSNMMDQWVRIFDHPSTTPHIRKVYECVYHAGFVDADGSIFSGTTRSCLPTITMAVGDFSQYHQMLCKHNEFKTKKGDCRKKIDKNFLKSDKEFVNALSRALVLKRKQLISVMSSAAPANTGGGATRGEESTPLSMEAKSILGQLLSHQNYVHGNNITLKEYRRMFTTMIAFEKTHFGENHNVPLLFLLYTAGFIGGDGGVGYDKNIISGGIYQSSLNFLTAFAEAIHNVMGFETPLVLAKRNNEGQRSANSRANFELKFNKKQFEKLIFTVGALDYNRRSQWIISLVANLVRESDESDIPNRERVMMFLYDLLRLVRKWLPSEGWRWVLINFNGQVVHVFR